MRKRVLVISSFIIFLFVFMSASIFKTIAEESNNSRVVTETKNYILADVDEEINLNSVQVIGQFGDVTLDLASITTNESFVTITSNLIKATSKGIFELQFSYNNVDFPIYLITKDANDTSYTLFEENFDNLSNRNIPSNYKLEKGSASIKDNTLFLNGKDANPTIVLLPEYLKGFSNYIIESDFTLSDVANSSRWASVIFRYEPKNYYQMAIRKTATATNGVEFAKAINDVWNVPASKNFSENIDSNSWYKLKIEVMGNLVNEYINEQQLVSYDNASEFQNGRIGMQANGSYAFYDNIKITLPCDYIDQTPQEYYPIPSVYEPVTNIVNPATVVQKINNQEDINKITGEVTPATAIFTINKDLVILDANKQSLISIDEALDVIKRKVIPAFYINDEETVINLANYLKEKNVKDFFVITKDGELIKKAREIYSLVRGVLEFEYDVNKPILSKDDLLELRNARNKAQATVALLPIEYTTQENVKYLQKRLTTVWSYVEQDNISNNYQAILSGSNGIITNNYQEIFDIYSEFPENSFVRKPLIIGHRGITSLAPENSIEGTKMAFDQGVDIVELDIHMTKDGHLVVYHDFTTGRLYSEDLNIFYTDLADLKALTYNDTNYPNLKIKTFEEYLDVFTGEDVVFFVEIKSYAPEVVEKLQKIITDKNMIDNIVVISFQTNQIQKMNELFPEVSNGLLHYAGLITDQIPGSIENVLNTTVPINSTINPSYIGLNKEFIKAINHRGISVWPWTINDSELNEFYYMGVGGITSDTGNYFNDLWMNIEMNDLKLKYTINGTDNSASLTGKIILQNGESYEFVPEYEIIDDGNTSLVIEKGRIIQASNPGIAKIKVSKNATLPDGSTITLFGDVVTVEVTKNNIEESDYTLLYVGIGVISVGLIATLSIVLIKRRKQ